MRILTVLHRWWGIAFCLLFAMWFASGIVMHFVPFPARIEPGHTGGLAVTGSGGVRSEQDALQIAAAYAREGRLDASRASVKVIDYDQWTVAGGFDSDRPLYRTALGDDAGTELYVSSATGNVVLLTTKKIRLANYLGSIAHWVYPTVLRQKHQLWSVLMWWLSLVATVGASIGAMIGVIRLRTGSAYQGLRCWHHTFGLILAPFILCWIFSGFLSVSDGGLFSFVASPAGLFRAMHTFDFPPLASRPWLRTSLIVGLCLCGLAFSLTGVTLAWRRIALSFAGGEGNTYKGSALHESTANPFKRCRWPYEF
jgi:hypothetical protein